MMATTGELKSLLDIVDSIHNSVMDRLITGQRDPISKDTLAAPKSISDDAGLKSYIDSQRGTF
jgi:hypothetical protein